jgi:hypothetical protein
MAHANRGRPYGVPYGVPPDLWRPYLHVRISEAARSSSLLRPESRPESAASKYESWAPSAAGASTARGVVAPCVMPVVLVLVLVESVMRLRTSIILARCRAMRLAIVASIAATCERGGVNG